MLIGITGGIGSGKSTIAQALRDLGYSVYDTDTEAKRLMQEDATVRTALIRAFGEETYLPDGTLNRECLKDVFHNPLRLQEINAIVHPAVFRDVQQWAKQQPGKLCFAESAILFESGMNKMCDAVVIVTAPMQTRIERTMRRDHCSREQVLARLHNQLSDDERAAYTTDRHTHTTDCPTILLTNDGNTPIPSLCTQIINRWG